VLQSCANIAGENYEQECDRECECVTVSVSATEREYDSITSDCLRNYER